jgi:hypothetical protein
VARGRRRWWHAPASAQPARTASCSGVDANCVHPPRRRINVGETSSRCGHVICLIRIGLLGISGGDELTRSFFGTRPTPVFAVCVASCCRRTWLTAAWLAPSSSSVCRVWLCPCCAARCNGVQPAMSLWSTYAAAGLLLLEAGGAAPTGASVRAAACFLRTAATSAAATAACPNVAALCSALCRPCRGTATQKVANRDVSFRVGDRSRGRDATPADFPRHDGTLYRGLHVRRWGLDVSIVQGPFSVAPCQTLASRFATFASLYESGWAHTHTR